MGHPFTLVLGSFVLLGSLSSAQSAHGASPLERAAEAALELTHARVGWVETLAVSDESVVVSVNAGDTPLYLDLTKHSVRSADFAVRAQLEDGSWVDIEPEPVRTYRGTLLGEPDSRVAATLLDGQVHARIVRSSGEQFWLEPLAPHTSLAVGSQHALYRNEDTVPLAKTCASDLFPSFASLGGSVTSAPKGGATPGDVVLGGTALTTAELGCDADYEYFQDQGSSVSGVTNQIELVINMVNSQYENDVSITHAITTILVRTSSNDPYTKKPADQLLYQFRAEWNANQSSVPRDVAHLFTGRTLSGSTIGIAFIGTVCNLDVAYGLVESDFTGNNLACSSDLSAHELGHNWNAPHCACTSHTMNSYITCANQFNPASTVPIISAFRDAQSCFGSVEPPADPVSIHVASITPGTVNIGQGRKRGTATVTIVKDNGVPEAGATVMGSFTGDFNEAVSGVTNGSGSVTFTTTGFKKGGVSFTFCVDGTAGAVSGSLPYVPGDNAEDCDSL